MQAKILLRFYFHVDDLEKSLNCVMYRQAFSSHDTFKCAENILQVIEEKSMLSELWNYLDGIISRFGEEDKQALFRYANLRTGFAKQPKEEQKALRRVVVRFNRRLQALKRYAPHLRCVAQYATII